jgi:hypothetical protein
MRRLLVLLALGMALLAPPAALAESHELTGANQSARIDFGEEILFLLEAPWSGPAPSSVTVFYGLPDGALRTFAYADDFTAGPTLSASYSWDIRDILVPGAEIEYSWRVITAEGDRLTSPPSVLVYEDPDLPWNRVSDENVEIVWHAGGPEFGEQVLAYSQAALTRLEETFGISLEHRTRIVIYEDGNRMREALGGGTSPWVGGQAIGPFNVIVFAATPFTPDLELLLAHELTHIVIDQVSDNPFSSPPSWIHEGLATINESAGALRFDYPGIVEDALERDALLSLRGLTGSFPASSSGAILAYAESNSLLLYVIDTYGADSIGRLLRAYRQGVTDDEAVNIAIGIGLTQLEDDWLASLRGEEPARKEKSEPAPTATPADTATAVPAEAPTPALAVEDEASPEPTPTEAIPVAVAEAAVVAEQPAPAVPTPVPTPVPAPAEDGSSTTVIAAVVAAVGALLVGSAIWFARAGRRT